jgi:cobalt/nickel transport system ATP-binding protein
VTEPWFSVEHVSFAYPGHGPCLDDVSFAVAAGERLVLLGPNGSGKSTMLHLLDGLYFPATGSVCARGQPLTEAALEHPPFGPCFRQQVGLLFQNSDVQLFCPTVEDELAFGPLQLRWPPAEIREHIADTLRLLEIERLRQRPPQSLSGGEKKRVALASLLVLKPAVLLLDEPTAGLDPRSQSLMLDLLEALRPTGVTLITATHELTLVPHLADRAIVLGEDHRIAADAPADKVLADLDLLARVNLIHAHSHHHGRLMHHHPH